MLDKHWNHNKMKKNQEVTVKSNHPFHGGRIGYFQFFGAGPSEGAVVLSSKPTDGSGKPNTIFAVNASDLVEMFC